MRKGVGHKELFFCGAESGKKDRVVNSKLHPDRNGDHGFCNNELGLSEAAYRVN